MNSSQQDAHVQLWLAPVAACEPAQLAAYETLLSPDERARWTRFRYPADRLRFLIGRAFMRTVLAECLGHGAAAALQFTLTPHGKPELGGRDAGELHFNLSHTDELLVLAISRAHTVGVDVEAVTRNVELLALAQRYFAAHEYTGLLALDTAAQRERFFVLWTLMEAWLKARGLGLRIPLDAFSFSLAGRHPAIEFGPQLPGHPQDWQFRVLAHDQFRIALAVECAASPPLQVQKRTWCRQAA